MDATRYAGIEDVTFGDFACGLEQGLAVVEICHNGVFQRTARPRLVRRLRLRRLCWQPRGAGRLPNCVP